MLFKQEILCVWIVKAFVSIMYKKLHIEKYLSSQESLSSKGSFLVWVPEKSIMVTRLVYILKKLGFFTVFTFCTKVICPNNSCNNDNGPD